MTLTFFGRTGLFFLASFALSPLALACSSCGCTLSSDWAQPDGDKSSLKVDLRYDYINQTQLRTGTGVVDRSKIDLPAEREIEQRTQNHYTILGFDYSRDKDWGVKVQIPWVNRPHSTVAEGDTDISTSSTNGLGDVRVLGRYQNLLQTQGVVFEFGLKLPTGSIHDRFKTGPQAGNALDRGLQAGTGTTDLLLGVNHFGKLSPTFEYFTQGALQVALNSREQFRPGNSLSVNAGVRFSGGDNVIPQLQLNVKTSAKDKGDNADRDNSGGTLAYLSPGATVQLDKQWQLYGFVQVPVYQKVNGYQLAPRSTFSVGVRYSM